MVSSQDVAPIATRMINSKCLKTGHPRLTLFLEPVAVQLLRGRVMSMNKDRFESYHILVGNTIEFVVVDGKMSDHLA